MNYELYMYFINLMDRVKQFGFLLLNKFPRVKT